MVLMDTVLWLGRKVGKGETKPGVDHTVESADWAAWAKETKSGDSVDTWSKLGRHHAEAPNEENDGGQEMMAGLILTNKGTSAKRKSRWERIPSLKKGWAFHFPQDPDRWNSVLDSRWLCH